MLKHVIKYSQSKQIDDATLSNLLTCAKALVFLPYNFSTERQILIANKRALVWDVKNPANEWTITDPLKITPLNIKNCVLKFFKELAYTVDQPWAKPIMQKLFINPLENFEVDSNSCSNFRSGQ